MTSACITRLAKLTAGIRNEDERYTDANRKTLLAFIDTCRSKKLTDERTVFYVERIRTLCGMVRKDFKAWTREDVEEVMRQVNGREYKPWTVEAFKTTLKVLFRWFYQMDAGDPAPRLVSWLTRETPHNDLRREDLLTKKEVNDMIRATNRLEFKAMVAIMAAGPRPSELFGIQLKDVHDEGDFIKIYVRGKMHRKLGERCVYVGFFDKGHLEYIRMWMREHPGRGDPKSLMFPGQNNARLIKDIKIFAKKAGIKKDVRPYLFRHVFGTWCYGNYEGSYARRLMGHAAGSVMEGVYCHLSETDIEARLLGSKPKPEAETEKDVVPAMQEHDELIRVKAELESMKDKLAGKDAARKTEAGSLRADMEDLKQSCKKTEEFPAQFKARLAETHGEKVKPPGV